MYTHTQTHEYACWYAWLYEERERIRVRQPAARYPQKNKQPNMYTWVSVHVYKCFFFFVCCSEYTLQLVVKLSVSPHRTLYLYINHLSALPPGVFAGLSSLGWVCVLLVTVWLVAEYWDSGLECKCWFSIITWHAFACVFSVACVCVCVCVCVHGVHR